MAGNSNVTLPTSISYSPLPDGPNNRVPSNRRPKKKLLLLIFSGFIAVAVIFISTKDPNVSSNQLLSSSKQNHGSSKEPTKLVPLSRGKPAGVSEKSNRLSADPNFPWNNSMLSWQRTAFHFQPEKNWMNDPNGPLYYKGWYHFFYQYNPNGVIWGNIVWGHAVSKDMIHWLHLPLAMVADQWYDVNGVWSGSATILPNDKVVMLYTGSTNESVQVQNLAYPSDPFDPLLIKWEKYSKNPVLIPPPGILDQDFRDPTTAWLTKEGKWRIVIGSKVNQTGISFVYDTEDFKTYTRLDGFLHSVPGTGMWECVDFFPVSLADDKQGVDTSANGPGLKHVIKASLDDDRHDYYAIGTYDESTCKWVPDDPKFDVGIGIRYDYGIFYASKTFYDQTKHRRVLWGWIGESDSEYADVKKGWASLQSMPRTIVLDKKTGNYLLQWPVEEAESLRLSSKTFENIEVKPGSVLPLDVGPATQLDIVAEFELNKKALERVVEANTKFNCSASGGVAERGALGPFGFLVLADEKLTEKTPVYFHVVKGADGNLKTHFCSDQKRSSSANDVKKDIYGSIVPVLSDEKLSLRILIDHSIVESFAQGGRTVITSRVYPTKAIYGAAKLFMFNNATEASVTANLKVWQMNSAFIRPFHPNKNYADASRIS